MDSIALTKLTVCLAVKGDKLAGTTQVENTDLYLIKESSFVAEQVLRDLLQLINRDSTPAGKQEQYTFGNLDSIVAGGYSIFSGY